MNTKRYVSTLYALFAADLLVVVLAFFTPGALFPLWILAHLGISVWVGLILHWMARRGARHWQLGPWVYWLVVVGYPLFVANTLLLLPAQWLIAAVITTRYVHLPDTGVATDAIRAAPDAADVRAPTPPTRRSGYWPLTAAALLFVVIVAVNLVAVMADKSEFRGLGLFFVHMLLVTPFFLAAPILLRYRSGDNIRSLVAVFQYFIYALLATSWVLLLSAG